MTPRSPRVAPKIRTESDAERGLATLIRWAGLPEPEREWRFHETRMWRLDFAYPSHMVAVEVEGGGFVGGRHTRGDGFERDCEKHSAAAALGWRVLRVTPRHIEDKVAVIWLKDALNLALAADPRPPEPPATGPVPTPEAPTAAPGPRDGSESAR